MTSLQTRPYLINTSAGNILHLSNHGRVRLVKNFVSYIKKFLRFDRIRESTLYNLSKNLSNDSYTKDSVRSSTKNMDPDGLMHPRVNNPFNQIIKCLNINSFRNKIDDLPKVYKNFQLTFFV